MTAVNKLRPALASTLIANRRQILVIDEAHCVSSWSESDFRLLYATVGQLRRILPIGTSVLAATATANRLIRASIQNALAFWVNPYIVNKGNFRANLIHTVHRMKGSEGAVGEVLQYFPSKTDLPLALVFVNSRSTGQKVLKTLTDYVDPSMRGSIHLYHAHLDDFLKKVLTDGFRSKKFRVLVSTESLTMVCSYYLWLDCLPLIYLLQ
jgi:superfamily II DNA helicase RecQ